MGKITGSKQNPAVKVLAIEEAKVTAHEDCLFIEGYANTKNHADRYGDVPGVYLAKRNYVYDFSEFKDNPVLLIDHVNKVDHIAGSIVAIFEDAKGLYFKAGFSKSDYPLIKHARDIYSEGHAKAISIAGCFHYENPENPNQLTLAQIYEISLVAVPADPKALAGTGGNNNEAKKAIKDEIDNLIHKINKK